MARVTGKDAHTNLFFAKFLWRNGLKSISAKGNKSRRALASHLGTTLWAVISPDDLKANPRIQDRVSTRFGVGTIPPFKGTCWPGGNVLSLLLRTLKTSARLRLNSAVFSLPQPMAPNRKCHGDGLALLALTWKRHAYCSRWFLDRVSRSLACWHMVRSTDYWRVSCASVTPVYCARPDK